MPNYSPQPVMFTNRHETVFVTFIRQQAPQKASRRT